MNKRNDLLLGLLNLHDAFLNASIQRAYMLKCPVETDPKFFLISDRGRFERFWVAFLFVLVEAWCSAQMAPVRSWISQITSLETLETLIKKGKKDDQIAKMESARHYMCHRDRRKYWDDGRLSVLGNLDYHNQLHMAFSDVLLTALRNEKYNKLKKAKS
jgi:hypothetical protein